VLLITRRLLFVDLIYYVYIASFALSRYRIWITSGLVLNVICCVSDLNEPMHCIDHLDRKTSPQVCQIGHFMANFEKFGHFLTALAMKKRIWAFYKIWLFFGYFFGLSL